MKGREDGEKGNEEIFWLDYMPIRHHLARCTLATVVATVVLRAPWPMYFCRV